MNLWRRKNLKNKPVDFQTLSTVSDKAATIPCGQLLVDKSDSIISQGSFATFVAVMLALSLFSGEAQAEDSGNVPSGESMEIPPKDPSVKESVKEKELTVNVSPLPGKNPPFFKLRFDNLRLGFEVISTTATTSPTSHSLQLSYKVTEPVYESKTGFFKYDPMSAQATVATIGIKGMALSVQATPLSLTTTLSRNVNVNFSHAIGAMAYGANLDDSVNRVSDIKPYTTASLSINSKIGDLTLSPNIGFQTFSSDFPTSNDPNTLQQSQFQFYTGVTCEYNIPISSQYSLSLFFAPAFYHSDKTSINARTWGFSHVPQANGITMWGDAGVKLIAN